MKIGYMNWLTVVRLQLFFLLLMQILRPGCTKHRYGDADELDPDILDGRSGGDKSKTPQIKPNKTHGELDEKLQHERTADLRYFQQQFIEAFEILGKPCNFSVYNSIMPEFWTELFKGTQSPDENEHFDAKFWNVKIVFGNHENMTVRGKCGDDADMIVEDCFADRTQQEEREKDLCFTGGLIECVESTGTCECMTTTGTITERVDTDKGTPSPKGFGCYVKVDEVCRTVRFGSPPLVFPCMSHGICNDFTSRCENLDEVVQ